MKNFVLASCSSTNAILSLIFSIQDIESIASLIFTILAILILLVNFSLRLYDKLKDGKISDDERKEIEKDLEELTNNLK